MRSKPKLVLVITSVVVVTGSLLFVCGILSTPRDFSSPHASVRLLDENNSPLSGIEVGRHWYDSDCNKDGSETTVTDQAGVAIFSKIPARVGLFTGAGRKAVMSLGMCGAGSGAHTTIYVRYRGLCDVVPKGKQLNPSGRISRDTDGVWFDTSTDSLGNTMANLTFPQKIKTIDYVLSSRPRVK